MKYIDKDVFKKWEQQVISKFYTDDKRKTSIVPSNTTPSSLIRSKCVIVLDLIYKNNLESNSEKVYNNDRKTLLNIENKFISLYHIGKKKNDLVDVKLETETDLFLHPAIDFGGLTNYRHKLGTKPAFLKSPYIQIDLSEPINDSKNKAKHIEKHVNEIYKTWKHLSNKNRFYGNMKSKLIKCIESIYSNKNATLKDVHSIAIKFVEFTPEHRVIVNSKSVMKYANNKYYVRVYGEGDKRHAISSNGKDMYCSIADTFITSNVNILNLRNEYHTY